MLPTSLQNASAPDGSVTASSTHAWASNRRNGTSLAAASGQAAAPMLPHTFSTTQGPQAPASSAGGPGSTGSAADIIGLTSNTVGARACENASAFANTCQLDYHLPLQVLRARQGLSKAAVPFGALITPLPDLAGHELPSLQRSPTACSACGAYMNAHCKVTAGAMYAANISMSTFTAVCMDSQCRSAACTFKRRC